MAGVYGRPAAPTRDEIKATAWRQLAEHGVEGLPLNAIAQELGMTGPALYRYVTSRDELLADLVVDAWEKLAGALERAAEENAGASAAKRLGAIGVAYRAWGTAHPLHGLISLELDRHLASMQLDPELLYRAELAELGGET